jgi:hypothetical protein
MTKADFGKKRKDMYDNIGNGESIVSDKKLLDAPL